VTAMQVRDLLELAWRSAGLPGFLRRPPSVEAAAGAVAERVRRREAAFLCVAEKLMYGVARNPLGRLLRWAGCTPGDLRRMVAADGVEATLARLHAAGVRVSADEFRGRAPLRRSGLELALGPRDFDNPRVGGGVSGATSGTTGRGLPVRYSWAFLAGEALHELLLLASHGLTAAPLALWLPAPPGIAGLHNLLVHARLGRPPDRWFSPSPPPDAGEPLARWADRGWRGARRLLPRLGPAAEWVPAEQADRVARWLAAAPRPALLKCFAGSAVRAAAAGAAAGLDLSGQVVFAGGEPLTESRRDFLSRSGLRAYARYAATETGFIAGACPLSAGGADMHLYADRLAVIAGGPAAGAGTAGPLAFTSLSLAAPKVLLNVELGDHGVLRRQACDCSLGRAGLSWRVAGVHDPARIAAEGVKLETIDLIRLVEEALRDLGGSPDDFQIWLGDGTDGASLPTIALAAQSAVQPEALRRRLRQRLPELAGGALAATLWIDAGALAIERRPLLPGPGQKLLRVVGAPDGARTAAPARAPGTGDASASRS